MKLELHVPVEQYGFVAATIDISDSFDIPTKKGVIRGNYNLIKDAFAEKPGLPPKEWNTIVDQCLKNELKLTPDQWEMMSGYQQNFLQEIKRSKARN